MVVWHVFYVHPYLGKMNPFWRAYFSDWLGLTTNQPSIFHPVEMFVLVERCRSPLPLAPIQGAMEKQIVTPLAHDVGLLGPLLGFCQEMQIARDILLFRGCKIKKISRWWNFKYFLCSPRKLGKMNPFWRAYFSGTLGAGIRVTECLGIQCRVCSNSW